MVDRKYKIEGKKGRYMGLHKRKGSDNWHIRISHNGREIRKTTGTVDKKKAQRVHDELKAKLWNLKYTDESPEYKWEDAVVRYLENKEKQVTDHELKYNIEFAAPFFRGCNIRDIDSDLVHKVIQERRKRVKGATANKAATHLRRIFTAAKRWGWIDGVPNFPRYEEEPRELALTKKEAIIFINALPDYLKNMTSFCLSTGLRRHNITHLKWTSYKEDQRELHIESRETKNKIALVIPLVGSAIKILHKQKGKDPVWVFPSPKKNGYPLTTLVNDSWKKARNEVAVITKNKKLHKLKFHDMRHTWATWHVQAGTDPISLMRMGGWTGTKSMNKYVNLQSDHLHKMARNIEKPHKNRTVPETIDFIKDDD